MIIQLYCFNAYSDTLSNKGVEETHSTEVGNMILHNILKTG